MMSDAGVRAAAAAIDAGAGGRVAAAAMRNIGDSNAQPLARHQAHVTQCATGAIKNAVSVRNVPRSPGFVRSAPSPVSGSWSETADQRCAIGLTSRLVAPT
jgi:hypothetical protein